MIYNWYNIFNINEFEALGLVSKTYTLELENIGEKSILVTKGIGVGMVYDDVFLQVGLNGANPYARDGYAVYFNDDGDIFLGVPVED